MMKRKKYFRRKCHEIVPKHSIQLNFNKIQTLLKDGQSEELEFAGNILFSSHVFQIGDVSFVRLKEVTLILISGLFPYLQVPRQSVPQPGHRHRKDYRWGLRFCRKRWLNQQKTGYCRMQRNSISVVYICEQSDNDNKHRQRY